MTFPISTRLAAGPAAGHPTSTSARILRPTRRLLAFGVLLALLGVVVPDSGREPARIALLKLDEVHGVDAADHTVWILALGSDARPGQSFLGSRSDAIQLVGINTVNGHAVTIGIPRDSWVDIPGFGNDKINAAMVYGGPQLTARAVANLVGITPDYVFVTSFRGVIAMAHAIGGITVRVRWDVTTNLRHYRPGQRHLNGLEVLDFARVRHGLPGGDFDRSLDQSSVLRGGLRQLIDRVKRQGRFESALYSFMRNVETDLSIGEIYRLARAVLQINPAKVRQCVVPGGVGFEGTASVVFPDVAGARALAARVRSDATLHGACF